MTLPQRPFVSARNASLTSQMRFFWFRFFTAGVNSATADQYANGQVGA